MQAPGEDWHAQYLGKCTQKTNVAAKEKGKLCTWYTFTVLNDTWRCQVHIDRESLLALFDECAPLFGFLKLGTTTLSMGKTRYTCVKENFSNLTPLIVLPETQAKFRQRVQDFLVLRWIFLVPVQAKKDLFLKQGNICARFVPPRPTTESMLLEDWFVDSVKESKLRLLAGRKANLLADRVHEAIQTINKGALIHLSTIASRLSPLS